MWLSSVWSVASTVGPIPGLALVSMEEDLSFQRICRLFCRWLSIPSQPFVPVPVPVHNKGGTCTCSYHTWYLHLYIAQVVPAPVHNTGGTWSWSATAVGRCPSTGSTSVRRRRSLSRWASFTLLCTILDTGHRVALSWTLSGNLDRADPVQADFWHP